MGYIIDPGQAFELMKESEKYGGHPCTRHIGLSNDELMRRMYQDYKGSGIVYMSTFSTVKDAAEAAHQTFKNLDSATFSRFFNSKQASQSFGDVRVDRTFNVRFAFAGSGPRVLPSNHMTLILFRPQGIDGNRFFVKTFFPRPPNEFRETPLPGSV